MGVKQDMRREYERRLREIDQLLEDGRVGVRQRGMLIQEQKDIRKLLEGYPKPRPKSLVEKQIAVDIHWSGFDHLMNWKDQIEKLIKEYGPEAILNTDAGANNVSFEVLYYESRKPKNDKENETANPIKV